jgi:hypothetical protein
MNRENRRALADGREKWMDRSTRVAQTLGMRESASIVENGGDGARSLLLSMASVMSVDRSGHAG